MEGKDVVSRNVAVARISTVATAFKLAVTHGAVDNVQIGTERVSLHGYAFNLNFITASPYPGFLEASSLCIR